MNFVVCLSLFLNLDWTNYQLMFLVQRLVDLCKKYAATAPKAQTKTTHLFVSLGINFSKEHSANSKSGINSSNTSTKWSFTK